MKKIYQSVLGSAFVFGMAMLPVCAEEVQPEPKETEPIITQQETERQDQPDPAAEQISQPDEVATVTVLESEEPELDTWNGWQEGNTKYYIENEAVNGLQKIDGDYYLFKDFVLDSNVTGLVKPLQGKGQVFLRNGKSDWTFTGVAKSQEDGKWYHVKEGMVDRNFTGLSQSVENGNWFFSRNGVLDWHFTGVAKSIFNNQWYHAKNGKLDWNFTGFSKSVQNGKWYFSRKGKLDWSFTGLSKSVANGSWYYSRNGKLDWNATGLGLSIANQKKYYFKKGKLNWNYTDIYQIKNNLYYVKKGAVKYGDFIENRTLYRANSKTGILEAAIHQDGRDYYLSQLDGRWKDKAFGGSKIGNTGCVPTSLSMAFNLLNGAKKTDPYSMAKSLYTAGYFNRDEDGAGGKAVTYACQKNGMSYKGLGNDFQTLKNELLKGHVVVLALQGYPYIWEYGSHELVIFGYDTRSNQCFVMDPYYSSNNTTFDLNHIFHHYSGYNSDRANNGPAFAIWK